MANLGWPRKANDQPAAEEVILDPGGGGEEDDMPQTIPFTGRVTVPAKTDELQDIPIFPVAQVTALLTRFGRNVAVNSVQFGAVWSGPRPTMLCKVFNEATEEEISVPLYEAEEAGAASVRTEDEMVLFAPNDKWRLFIRVNQGTYEEFTLDYTIQFDIGPPPG